MKKIISLILSFAIICATMSAVALANDTENPSETETGSDIKNIQGDINIDDSLDIIDVMLLRGHLTGTKQLTEDEQSAADMNGDGSLDVIDIALMRKFIIGVNDIQTSTETDTDTDTQTDTDTEEDTDVYETITHTYQVWVVNANTNLRIRTSASVNSDIAGMLSGGETLKIYETVSAGGYLWGKIYKVNESKTYDGKWCALTYATSKGTATETEKVLIHQASSGNVGKVVDTLPAVKTESQSQKLIRIKEDYTHSYNANHISSFYAPVYSQLPKGTLEYLTKTADGYYWSNEGRKYKIDADTTEIVNGYGFGENTLSVLSATEVDGTTVLKIKMSDKTAFNIQPYNVNYPYLNSDDYFYTVNEFNPTQIRITFDNVTAITGLPSFTATDLFSSYYFTKVTDNGKTKFCLVLKLRQSGIYNGARANYDSEGNLIIRFSKYPKSLSDAIIVIDPGHGYGDPGAIGTTFAGKSVYERDVNLAIAKRTAVHLREAGATVYILPTDTQNLSHKVRATLARQYNPDIFISIHSNSVASGYSSARGSQAYYFNSFSYYLAKNVVNNVQSVLGYSNLSANCLEGEYSVTLQNDFSSILLETAFMSNPNDLAMLTDSAYQDKIGVAITKGISQFLSRKK